ncbi:MAG: P-type DNA transfer ATPase VirB11, partial [Legionellales bacterium]|nr:P-type DNA transfer ATPase VirB11 [Legionellales bacterium]
MSQFDTGALGLLSPIQRHIDNPEVSEILINRPEEVFIEAKGCMCCVRVPLLDKNRLLCLFQLIASENNQQLNDEMPLLSGSLGDGSRVQLVLPPTAIYPTLSIRRKSVNGLSLNDYRTKNYYQKTIAFDLKSENKGQEKKALYQLYKNQDWPTFIKTAILEKKNIVISGGTSSGKTTFLNACLQEIPADTRIITLEDTREIDILHENKVQLLAHKHAQGSTKINM